jgi:hypothetical protein
MTRDSSPLCQQCGANLPPAKATGRPRRYCSALCRDDAYRDRIANEVWGEAQRDVVDEAALRVLTFEGIAAELEQREAAPPEEQLTRAVIETRVLAGQYQHLAGLVHANLAWRAQAMADGLRQELARLFGEETAL